MLQKHRSWKERLREAFLPVIRERGYQYAHERRVDVEASSWEKIVATVHGSRPYFVTLIDYGKPQKTALYSCTCPFFKTGTPCKHLWAAILEADRILEGGNTDSREMNGRKPEKADWQTLLSESLWPRSTTDPPWGEGPGRFLLCYELHIRRNSVTLATMEKYVRRDGALGRTRGVQPATLEHKGLPKADRNIIIVMDEVRRRRSGYFFDRYRSSRQLADVLLEPRDLEVLLPLLAKTGRCGVFQPGEGLLADPLLAGIPASASLKLQPEAVDGGRGRRLRFIPMVHFGSESGDVPLRDIPVFFRTFPIFFIWNQRLFELPGPSMTWIRDMIDSRELIVPLEEAKHLVIQARSLANGPEVVLPVELAPKSVQGLEPVPLLIVQIGRGDLKAQAFMDYGGLEVDCMDSRPTILDLERWVEVTRSLEAEARNLKVLEGLGFRENKGVFEKEVRGTAEVLSNLARKGWRVEGKDRKTIRGGTVSGLRVSSGIDWFDLEGAVTFGDVSIPLPRAVRAFLRGETLVSLGDGTVGLLPEQWLSRNLSGLELGSSRKGSGQKLRFSVAQALILDAMLEEGTVEAFDDRFLEVKAALREFSGIKEVAVSPRFSGVLRPYQQESLGWFAFLKEFGFGGVLADDMGLGKTVQVLAWLAQEMGSEGSGPSLVVVPTSLLFNWQSEAGRFVPRMRVLNYAGSLRKGLVEEIGRADLVLTTYGLVRRDIKLLKDMEFHYVILDESQAVKNAGSQVSKAVRLLHARHRLCLTGTPLENHVGELWSQMEFLNPGLMGSAVVFGRRFAKPISQGSKAAQETLARMVRPFILRRTKDAVEQELPDKVEHIIRCPMTASQARLYAHVRDHYRASVMAAVERQGMNRSRVKALEGLLRLRQAANHPALIGEESAGSGKLEELMTLLQETIAGGHKALVFSQFTGMLGLVRSALDKMGGVSYEYLDGRTPQARREERVRRFQEDDAVRLFLISLKAGGVGLNLTAADYVFMIDPWWNPAVELQAVDRTHRIGQDKKVFTYRLISTDTVEEKVLALQERKRGLVSSILAGGQNMLRQLSKDDLEILFS
jgi:superfamily II DNA or RNA helicase